MSFLLEYGISEDTIKKIKENDDETIYITLENNKEEKVVIETGTTTEVKGENSNTEKSINICCLLSFIFAIIGIFIYGLFLLIYKII